MLGVASGAVLVPLNSTMLAVALPSIMDQFGVDAVTVSSLVTLYLGRGDDRAAGQREPRRPVRPAAGLPRRRRRLRASRRCIAVVAPSFEVLAASRVLQAISGALVSTTSVALVRAMSPADRRGAAFGLFDMLVSTSAAIGPFIGGLLVGAFGWQSLFVLAVPVAIFAAIVVGRRRAARRPAATRPAPGVRTPGIDVPGLVLLAAMLIALLVAIRGLGGGDGGIGLVGRASRSSRCSSCSSASSSAPSARRSIRGCSPAGRSRAAVLGVLGATVILHATFILVPLLVERLLDGSAETAGLVLLGISGLGAVAAPFGGRLSDRRGRRLPVVAGSVCLTIGLVALWLVAAGDDGARRRRAARAWSGSGWASRARRARPRRSSPCRATGSGWPPGPTTPAAISAASSGASLAGAVLGTTVTAAGVTLGFGLLVLVGAGLIVVSFGLPGRIRSRVRRVGRAGRRRSGRLTAARHAGRGRRVTGHDAGRSWQADRSPGVSMPGDPTDE